MLSRVSTRPGPAVVPELEVGEILELGGETMRRDDVMTHVFTFIQRAQGPLDRGQGPDYVPNRGVEGVYRRGFTMAANDSRLATGETGRLQDCEGASS